LKAVILAAGRGERLQPITDTRPKPLIPIAGKTLLQRTLEKLAEIGVDEAIIVGSYMINALRNAVKGYEGRPHVRLVDQGEPLGTGHALKAASSLIDEDFLLIYGDLMVEKPALLKVSSSKHDVIVGAIRVEEPWRYGVLVVDDQGRLINIVEKPPRGEEPSNLVNAGVYRLTPEILDFLDTLKPSPRGELELTDALAMMAREREVRVVELDRDEWFEIGYPWDLLDAAKRILGGLRGRVVEGEVEPGARLKGPVYVAPNAIIRSGAYIKGPVYVGEGSEVGPNCYVRGPTIIERDVRIGNAVEVKASMVLEHSRISHLSYVGDSVVGEHVNLGAGTITANLRFDDKDVKVRVKGQVVSSGRRKLGAFIGGYVKTGINVSILPGVKIGAYSWIIPGSVVVADVPPKSIYKSRGYRSYEVKPLRLDSEQILKEE